MKKCEYCNGIIEVIIGKGRFCSIKCIRCFARKHVKKGAISLGLKKYWKNSKRRRVFVVVNKKCERCHKKYSVDKRKSHQRFCSRRCASQASGSIGGLHSSQSSDRRSKNEKYFAILCKRYFKKVEFNKPLFFGYDADVIIHDIKVAVLWNGMWHYKQLRKNHPLIKIKNRDKLKYKLIKKYGYVSYIIKDLGRYDRKFVLNQFNKFIKIYK